jgi:hypothetical protein
MLTLTVLSFSCRTANFSDHVRVYDNDTLIYHFMKDSAGKLLAYYDTLVCKIIVRRGVVRHDLNANRDVFYFETPHHPDTGATDIFTSDIPVNQFSYCFEKGDLYIGDHIGRTLNPIFMPMSMVIPDKVKAGKTYFYRSGDYKREFTFVRKEDIRWGEMLIKDALVFSIAFSSRQGLKTTDTVWLARTWGLVQWKRLDGYTGQLLK